MAPTQSRVVLPAVQRPDDRWKASRQQRALFETRDFSLQKPIFWP